MTRGNKDPEESTLISVEGALKKKQIKLEQYWPKTTQQFITFYMENDGTPQPKIATLEILADLDGSWKVIARAEINLCFHFGENFTSGTIEMIQVPSVIKANIHRINYLAKIKLVQAKDSDVFDRCVSWR